MKFFIKVHMMVAVVEWYCYIYHVVFFIFWFWYEERDRRLGFARSGRRSNRVEPDFVNQERFCFPLFLFGWNQSTLSTICYFQFCFLSVLHVVHQVVYAFQMVKQKLLFLTVVGQRIGHRQVRLFFCLILWWFSHHHICHHKPSQIVSSCS